MPDRDPEATLKILEDQALEDEAVENQLREVAAMSSEALAEAMRAEGIDPAAARADALDVAARAASDVRPPAAPRRARSRRVGWLAAAAAIALLAGAVGLTEGAAIVTWFKGEKPEPILPDHELPAQPTPREMAEKLRDEAVVSCNGEVLGTCRDKLDQARRLDPTGESEPRVQAARALIQSRTFPDANFDGKPRK